MPDPKRPRAFRLQDLHLGPGEAEPRAPVVIKSARDPYEAEVEAAMAAQEVGAEEAAVEVAQKKGLGRHWFWSWAGLFWSAAGGLVALSFGLWLNHLIDDLFARAPALGVAGLVLAAAAGLALIVLAGREVAGVMRQSRIAELHIGLARARETDDFKEARRLVSELSGLYATRAETAQARDQLRDLARDIVDGRDLIDIAERTLVHPLDLEVRQEIASAAKRVSMVTAIAPRAIIDIVFVVAQAIRLIGASR